MTISAEGRMCWLDVETSGLDPSVHRLLEVGMRVTEADLSTVAENTWLIPWDATDMPSIRIFATRSVGDMHVVSGLWSDLAAARPLEGMAATEYCLRGGLSTAMSEWVREHAKGLPLAGSSVHFDRAWLTEWAPYALKPLSYRHIDVSTVKELAQRWAPEVIESCPKPAKRHRVQSDIDDSIAELKHYRDHLWWGF